MAKTVYTSHRPTIHEQDRPDVRAGTPVNLHGEVLKYPLDLESANGHYMIFNIYARTNADKELPAVDQNISNDTLQAYNNSFTRERFFDDTTNLSPAEGVSGTSYKLIKDSIALYMPDDLSVNFKSNYAAAEVGALVAGAAGVADVFKGASTFRDLTKGMGMTFARTIEPLLTFGTLGTGQGALAALQRKTGLAPAPLQEMIFEGIDYRTFNYTFKMTPRNRKEAQEVKKIIDTFTFHMLPEKLGTGSALAFRVPSEFTIRYMYRGQENNYLNHLTYCALSDVKVDYGSGEKFAAYRPDDIGAPPVSTTCTLTFTELELVDRRRAITGYKGVQGTHRSRKLTDSQGSN